MNLRLTQALEFGEIKQMADKAGLFKSVLPLPLKRPFAPDNVFQGT